MADLMITIWRKDTWLPTDKVALRIGSPAASFFDAALTGEEADVLTVPAWPSLAAQGGIGGQVIGEAVIGVNVNAPRIGEALIGYSTIGNPALPLQLKHRWHPPTGMLCGWLPLGVSLIDAVGNRSAVLETKVRYSDPPTGARRIRALASDPPDTPGIARLTWALSADVEAA